jgi:deoxyhypusine synthase
MTARHPKRSSAAAAAKGLGAAVDPHKAWPNDQEAIRTGAAIAIDEFQRLPLWAHRGEPSTVPRGVIGGPKRRLKMARKSAANPFLRGTAIAPPPVRGEMTTAELVDCAFLAYNARRLRDACRLFAEKMLAPDTIVGMSVTGALTPAGLGMSCLIPLIENGFIDWIVSTGANLYHDTHFGIGLKMFQGSAEADDIALRKSGVVRIYDIFFDYEVLLSTDAFFRQLAGNPEFQQPMSTAQFHYRAGRYVAERGRVLKLKGRSLLAAAYEHAVPVYTS